MLYSQIIPKGFHIHYRRPHEPAGGLIKAREVQPPETAGLIKDPLPVDQPPPITGSPRDRSVTHSFPRPRPGGPGKEQGRHNSGGRCGPGRIKQRSQTYALSGDPGYPRPPTG